MSAVKTCTSCGISKPETTEYFAPHKDCRGGLDTGCRTCRQAQKNAWRHRNADRIAEKRRAVYAAENGERWKALEAARKERHPFRVTAERLIAGMRERAKKNDLEMAPELRKKDYVESWLKSQPTCECCGVEFHTGRKDGSPNDRSPSFDRFELDKGYTLKNTALICWRCNNIERNYNEIDLRKVADWIERRRADERDQSDLFDGHRPLLGMDKSGD